MDVKDSDGLSMSITERKLHELAGARSFERGAAYFESSAVEELVDTGSSIRARVRGTADYPVALQAAGAGLDFDCDCPVGEGGELCKHAVAAGLAWLAERAERRGRSGAPTERRIREHLLARDKADLVERLMGRADDDPAYMQRLQGEVLAGDPTSDPKAFKETIRRALAVRGFVDYRGMRRFLDRARPVADLLARLLADGRAEPAMELADYALQRGLVAYEKVDDSAGSFGDLLRELSRLHLEACRAAAPDGKALAGRLLRLQLADDWGLIGLEDFTPLLGEAGLAEYRRRAEREWAKVPARGPGQRDTRAFVEHFKITSIMQALAERDGDVDALIEIKRRDLTYPYHFLEIAKRLEEAGRGDEALDWAERGRAAFPDWPDARLVEWLIGAYRGRGRHGDAAELAWDHFRDRPGLEAYRWLRAASEGAGDWPARRERALAWMRDEHARGRPSAQQHEWRPAPPALLTEILLWEGDVDAALAEARAGGAPERLWLELAAALETKRPAEAAGIYRALIEPIVRQTNNDAYDRAVELAAKVRALMGDQRGDGEFAEYADELRRRHKQKRNFVARLDALLAGKAIGGAPRGTRGAGRRRRKGG